MTPPQNLHGLLAELTDHIQLVAAARRAREQGYRHLDAYSPFPIEELPEALGHPRTVLPLIVLLGAMAGAAGGYFMQWYAMAVDYPINVGGRPLHSWPAFVPIMFELTILVAALSGAIGMLALNGLPRLHHPVFNVAEFERASTDRFFLCIEASDPQFDAITTRQFLESLPSESVREVAL